MPVTSWTPNQYPSTHRSDHVDVYKSASRGEVRVADPYQWLEEDTDETDKWTSAQEGFTRQFLDKNPDLPKLEKAFKECTNYAKFSAPRLRDDNRWYWFYNAGLEPQTIMYRTKNDTQPDISTINNENTEVFFDPNVLTEDGTAALSTYAFSEKGEYFAYAISYSGSDFVTVYVRPTDSPLTKDTNVKNDTGRLSDEIKFVKFSSITWTPDSKGFFYQRLPDNTVTDKQNKTIATGGDLDAMLYYHRLGTSQSEDILIHQDKEHRDWMFGVDITEDHKYILLHASKDTSRKNLLWIADYSPELIGQDIRWNKVINEFEAEYDVITNDGPIFFVRTNLNAPQHKIITIDISKNNETRELVAETDASLTSVSSVNKKYFALTYKRDVKDEVYIYTSGGKKLERLAEDFVGAAIVTSREKQPWFFVTFSGFTTPGMMYKYDFTAPEGQKWNFIGAMKPNGLNGEEFEATQVWYESKDGTKVPMFIVRHKSTEFDGTAPAIQYGYGGFSISIDPFFSPAILSFLRNYGAILAVPNIRGGGEFGEEWHLGGCRETKGNCFDDFIAATQYLVKHKYAAPDKVIINGGSNGGLLVSASVNRAPEGTFGCAISEVGVHDLLKFHKFTIGRAWISDYGNPDDPKDFDFIYPLSALHNIPKDKILPPTMLLTADHDDRVVPMHSFKMAASLQHVHAGNPNPLLLRVDKKAGHGAGKSTLQKVKENADKWGFAAQTLGLVWREPVDHPNL